jgi:hypothetical protein
VESGGELRKGSTRSSTPTRATVTAAPPTTARRTGEVIAEPWR